MQQKLKELKSNLKAKQRVLIAFSGGVDSTFLLRSALDVLDKDNVLAVTANSKIRFQDKINQAAEIAQNLGARHLIIETSELNCNFFSENNEMRCYYCKYELYQTLKNIAQKEDIQHLLDGTNQDDMKRGDRPGHKALKEFNIETPLQKAGLTKKEIRKLSKEYGLPTWNQPSDTCLATRVAYGISLDEIRLESIREMELFLREYNFTQLRVRLHDEKTLRLEVLPGEMNKIMDNRRQIVKEAERLGFTYITMDLIGYRSGSMNEVVEEKN